MPSGDWHPGDPGWRWLVFEAALLLALANALVRGVRFRYWRYWLGRVETPDGPRPAPGPHRQDERLAAAVERAAARLPFVSKCLPRAMALHWMLLRRHRASILVMAILPGTARGTLDDLHAWVEADGRILVGASELPYKVIACFVGR